VARALHLFAAPAITVAGEQVGHVSAVGWQAAAVARVGL
jgi:hypothetical protein